MGKANNLGDFMTDLADAIREKTGATEPINPQEFSQKILDLGGERAEAAPNDIVFHDCDGKRLYSFTKDEFIALNEMPSLPTKKGLICQGWNWELEAAKAQVAECGKCEIGATYITDDGKTRLYITITDKLAREINIRYYQASNQFVSVDFGDGSDIRTYKFSGLASLIHKYDKIGEYCITFEVPEGGYLEFGGSSSACVLRTDALNSLQRVEFGKGVTLINGYAFHQCSSLSSVVIPNGVTSIGSYAFNECSSLSSVVIPNGVTGISTYTFYRCGSLSSVVIPKGLKKIGDYVFYECRSLSSVVIPQGVTSIGNYTFRYINALSSVVIPQGVTSIGTYAFDNCRNLKSVVIPQGVTSIGNYTFQSCSCLLLCDFSTSQEVPSVGSSTFSSTPTNLKIVVPDALYDTWKAATNWSASASKIIKKSDWDAQNA